MVTEADVVTAYRFFLGREPENREVVEEIVRRALTLEELRSVFLNSAEFRQKTQLPAAPSRLAHCKPLNRAPNEVEAAASPEVLQRMLLRIRQEFLEMGASQPHWSVLAADRFRAANIAQTEGEFFDSGKECLDDLLAASARCGLDLGRVGACFELGCGIGRTTIQLARRFPEVIGADISRYHLTLAREAVEKSNLTNVTFLNIGNLEQFDSLPEYDLFFSLIVLQHNPPPLMALILEKVLARLAPGGVAYFQTATHMTDYHFSVAAYLETPPMVGNAKVHCLPQHVLFELVQRAGCDILEIREDSSLGETTVSNRLLLRKRDGTSGHGSLQRFTMNEPDQRPVDQPLGVPQRYSINRERYELRGGLIRLTEDARGFIANGANHDDMARFYFLCLVFDQIVTEQLTGDFAELGVYRGHTASLLAQMARHLGRTAFLLDTYAGFDAADVKGIDAGVEMAFVDTSLEAVRALVGDRNVRFVQGHFPESAAQLPQEGTYCLVHLDCDLYAPMIAALNYFYTRLVPGGFLIIHDYSSLHWNGVERAVHEFLCDKSESLVPMPDSAGSIIIRKTRSARRRDNWYARRIATVFGPDWISGGNGSLGPALEYGWSAPEQWGVWGIDEVHRLRVVLGTPPTADIVLEFDVSAFLLENATRREVLVKANGQMIDRWIFTADDNMNRPGFAGGSNS